MRGNHCWSATWGKSVLGSTVYFAQSAGWNLLVLGRLARHRLLLVLWHRTLLSNSDKYSVEITLRYVGNQHLDIRLFSKIYIIIQILVNSLCIIWNSWYFTTKSSCFCRMSLNCFSPTCLIKKIQYYMNINQAASVILLSSFAHNFMLTNTL